MSNGPPPTSFTLPFSAPGLDLESAGGKGANLARLAKAGYPVPDGFVVTTAAYRAFVADNGLEDSIGQTLTAHRLHSLDELESASAEIRERFAAGAIPSEVAEEVLRAYRSLGSPPAAVRSSATVEDLPGLSFAGQQETFLNVVNEAALLKAVVTCWSSLWTGRAIGYRIRQGIPHQGLALAVVVQQMVQSEVSGVMFTANPLTGLRSQVVIDASFGLGEALVSGQVEPDHYVVDTIGGSIVEKTLGSKSFAIRSRREGGTTAGLENAGHLQALPDEQILALAKLGHQVAAEVHFPQDIEWAWANRSLYLLQARPVTSLFPVPENMAADPLQVLFSFGAVQGMLDPVTPLGRDFICLVFATGSGLMGYRRTAETQTVLHEAGERLWGKITPLLRNSVGRSVTHGALSLMEPTILQALEVIWDDPRLQPGKKGISFSALRHLGHFIPKLAVNVLLNLLSPDRRRSLILANGEKILTVLSQSSSAVSGDRRARLLKRIDLLPEIASQYLPRALLLYVSGVASGMVPFNLLNNLASGLPKNQTDGNRPGWNDLALEITRGLPYNPTTEMDLALWDTAQAIRQDPPSLQAFQERPAGGLAQDYLGGRLPPAAQGAIGLFMDKYGGRGLAEIDLGRPRWREEPTHIMQVLGSYMQIEDVSQSPNAVFRRGALRAGEAVEELAAGLRKTRYGWFKARLARWAARRTRALLGMREAPKFFAVRLMGLIRQALLESGAEFVQAGELDQADDLLYLTLSEIRSFAQGDAVDWLARIASRRTTYARELLRRQVPRLLLSDGRAFYEGMTSVSGAGSLTGAPVSPGVVEGPVRVILDPRGAQLLPGEIMVCPGTDPSWTPLFLAAGGLVMEVGGMMTHGAVVAREYGIPAVVGVHEATTRLTTGQRIRLDGSSGKIDVL
jgi:phosphohistidine swiveling domain-containing protein